MRRRRERTRHWLVAVVAAIAACVAATPAGAVTIRRTAHGIPHITASTFKGLGQGYGYAFAQDDLCTMAADYVTLAGQRSRYFGAHGTYTQGGNGARSSNLDSDVFWKDVIASGAVARLAKHAGPQLRALERGYVAGWNQYLRHVGGATGINDPRCHGRRWVRKITTADVDRRIYQLLIIAGQGVAIQGIAESQPPTGAATAARARGVNAGALVAGLRRAKERAGLGSNAVAVGRAGTADHRHGLLLGNPHFPWIGTERFYQSQLTIPGKLDVEGASLYGVPLVLIGHTKSLAWSHTVSTAYRFTPYELKLAPGNPRAYVVDGKTIPMTHRTVSVRLKDGTTVKRTLYATRWGPIVNNLQGTPLPWSSSTAFTMLDANRNNYRLLKHFLAVDEAQSVGALLKILKRYEGLPWVNTIAADRGGHALYADIGTVPNVDAARAKRCDTAIGTVAYAQLGLPILDGSRASCAWGNDRGAPAKGIFGPGHLPYLERSDYVTNSNDSYWLANPAHPLEGYARIIGTERTPRSLRTRIGLIMTKQIVGHGGFTRSRMQKMVFSDRQYAGELMRPALVALCRGLPGGQATLSGGGTVAVGDACDVLAKWDLHENLGSRGAALFRRFLDHVFSSGAVLWKTPFDVHDPVHTPRTLNTADPAVEMSLGDAIADLRGAHIALGSPLRALQYEQRGSRRIPIHGGTGDPNGEFNAIDAPWVDGKGFQSVDFGSSYVQVVTWHKGTCPDTRTILTYSQSENPRSRFRSDQTKMFSGKHWVAERFCARDVARHTVSTTVLNGRRVSVRR